jgi:hypothetical protein
MNEAELVRQLNTIESLLRRGDTFLITRKRSVSRWSVAEQLDHATKVCRSVLGTLNKGEPLDAAGINFIGRAVLLAGRIPRGKGESPAAVRGEQRPAAEILETLAACRELLKRWMDKTDRLPPKARVFKHPYFGALNTSQTVKFLHIHTAHHLKIVEEIVKQ